MGNTVSDQSAVDSYADGHSANESSGHRGDDTATWDYTMESRGHSDPSASTISRTELDELEKRRQEPRSSKSPRLSTSPRHNISPRSSKSLKLRDTGPQNIFNFGFVKDNSFDDQETGGSSREYSDEAGSDPDTGVSVELNPNRALREQKMKQEYVQRMREVELIQLHSMQDEHYAGSPRRSFGQPSFAGSSPRSWPISPIHLEHLPSPPITPRTTQFHQTTVSSPRNQKTPILVFGKDGIARRMEEVVSPERFTKTPTSPMFVAANSAKLQASASSPKQALTTRPLHTAVKHSHVSWGPSHNHEESRYPGGDEDRYNSDFDARDAEDSVEHSLMTSPEEVMARNIIQARIKKALAKELSDNESLEELQTIPSNFVKTSGIFDHAAGNDSFEEADIEFVQQYEAVFDRFIDANLNLMAKHPEMIYNLRVAKLQKILQVVADAESESQKKIKSAEAEKRQLLLNHKKALVDAARNKAALEIQLRQELAAIEQATLQMAGKLTWQFLLMSICRARNHHELMQSLSSTKGNFYTILNVLPPTAETQGIRDALITPASTKLNDKQQSDLRRLQVDNTLLKAQIKNLEKKIAAHQMRTRSLAWVDSVCVRMEPKHMKKLKHRFQKSLGVSF